MFGVRVKFKLDGDVPRISSACFAPGPKQSVLSVLTFGIGYRCFGKDENGDVAASLVYVLAKRRGREAGCDGIVIGLDVGRGTNEMGSMVDDEDLDGRGRLEMGRSEEIGSRVSCPSKNPPYMFGNIDCNLI